MYPLLKEEHRGRQQRYQAGLHVTLLTWFRANIANGAAWKGLPCLDVADLDDDWVRAIPLALDDKLRHDDCVISSATKTSDPPLGRSERRGVHDELFRLFVPSCSRLDRLHVGAVSEFGLPE